MAIIYLRHPVYGTKVACMDSEASYDQTRGWEVYDPLQLQDEPVNSLVPVRRGRPRKESVNGDSRRAD
jgi:hypothetical protein